METRKLLRAILFGLEGFNYLLAVPGLLAYIYLYTQWTGDEFKVILISTGIAILIVLSIFCFTFWIRFRPLIQWEKEPQGNLWKEKAFFWLYHLEKVSMIEIFLRYAIGYAIVVFSYFLYFPEINVILFSEIGIGIAITLSFTFLFQSIYIPYLERKLDTKKILLQLKPSVEKEIYSSKLSRVLGLQTVLAFIAAILLLFIINYRLNYEQEIQFINTAMSDSSLNSEKLLRLNLVDFRDKLTQSVLGKNDLKEQINRLNATAIQNSLNEIQLKSTNHAVESLFYYKPGEEIFISTNVFERSKTGAIFFIEDNSLARSGPFRHPAIKSFASGDWVSPYTLPVYNAKNEFLGYLGGFLNIGKLAEFILGNISIGRSGEAGLFASDGTIIFHTNQKKIGSNAKTLPVFNLPFQTEVALGFQEVNHEGDTKKIYFVKNPEFQYIIFASFDISELFEKSLSSLITTLFISLLVVLAIGGITIIVLDAKLRPLETIKSKITKMAEGKISEEFYEPTRDEVGGMANTMNEFQGKLKSILGKTQLVSKELSDTSSNIYESMLTLSDAAQNQAASSEEISASIEEITAGIESVTQRTETQSFTLASLLKKMLDLNSSVQEIDNQFQIADHKVESITREATLGAQSLEEMKQSMETIYRSSSEMTSVIEIIHTISEQINLLSLNAAIEAARAGASGRGFAVVADEISKLAEKTARSIDDIESLIQQNEGEIQKGQEKIETSIATLGGTISGVNEIYQMTKTIRTVIQRQIETNGEVNEGVEQIRALSEMIREATEEQKVAMMEISRSISEINAHAQTTAMSAENTKSSSQNMNHITESLKKEINYFHD